MLEDKTLEWVNRPDLPLQVHLVLDPALPPRGGWWETRGAAVAAAPGSRAEVALLSFRSPEGAEAPLLVAYARGPEEQVPWDAARGPGAALAACLVLPARLAAFPSREWEILLDPSTQANLQRRAALASGGFLGVWVPPSWGMPALLR